MLSSLNADEYVEAAVRQAFENKWQPSEMSSSKHTKLVSAFLVDRHPTAALLPNSRVHRVSMQFVSDTGTRHVDYSVPDLFMSHDFSRALWGADWKRHLQSMIVNSDMTINIGLEGLALYLRDNLKEAQCELQEIQMNETEV